MRAFVPSPQTPYGPWSLILPSVRYLILRSIYFYSEEIKGIFAEWRAYGKNKNCLDWCWKLFQFPDSRNLLLQE